MIRIDSTPKWLKLLPALIVIVFFGCKKNAPVAPEATFDFEGDVAEYNSLYKDVILFGASPGPPLSIVNKDGSGRSVIETPLPGFAGTWSPRKWKIFYLVDTSSGPASPVLYMMNVDGTGNRRITAPTERVWAAACSPDGRKIAYTVLDNVGRGKIRTINPDGTGARDITGFILSNQSGKLTWSPDSRRVAFDGSMYLGGREGIGYVTADGAYVGSLFPPGDQQCYNPDWSPDGLKVAYISHTQIEGNWFTNVFYYSFATEKSYQVTSRKAFAHTPHWSRDSKQIVFASYDVGGTPAQLYIVNADGSDLVQLAGGFNSVGYPDW